METKHGITTSSESADSIVFEPVSLTTLIDSSLISGIWFRSVPLTSGSLPPTQIDMVAESAAALEISPQSIDQLRKLVAEARALFGSHHYRRYRFLLTLSDQVAHFGEEHSESSDNRVPERMWLDSTIRRIEVGMLPHELVHSWNGKYRRPAGLATADFQKPMTGDLLWVYEGLTQYLGALLAVRSGLWSAEDYRDTLARNAASLDIRPGRTWRSLLDTAVAAQVLYAAPSEWDSWRRNVDFYDEGWLIWLEADITIRHKDGRP